MNRIRDRHSARFPRCVPNQEALRSAIRSLLAFVLLSVAGKFAYAQTLNPFGDAYVRDGSSAGTNFGSATLLEVRTSGSGNNRDSYFLFNIGSFTPLTVVRLRVYAKLSGSGSVGVSAYGTSQLWSETNINWNNRPPLGNVQGSTTVSGTSLTWYEFDVTSHVKAEKAANWTVVSLALHATSSSNRVMTINSRESATNKPELVTISTTPPTVSITSPQNAMVFSPPANITINATAADPDGSVAKVEFFQGAAKLGEDTTSPYSFAWSNVSAGNYSLTAVATDNIGARTTSPAVAIKVGSGPTSVSGPITANSTWTLAGSPYIVTSTVLVGNPAGPVLTIDPGVTVKFDAATGLTVGYEPGSLYAVGTASQPITFTSSSSTPAPGSWGAIRFYDKTSADARIAHATIAYGGASLFGSIYMIEGSPKIESATIQNSLSAAIKRDPIWYAPTAVPPVLVNCRFVGNGAAVNNQDSTTVFDARLNWWNASSGPSGAGNGSGEAVTAGVKFEPWLTGPTSQPHYFKSAVHLNRTLNPTISVNSTFNFETSTSGNWTVKILNGVEAVVRTLTGSGSSGSAVWNGKNDTGVDQPDGTYTYQLESTNAQSQVATPAKGYVILDRTKQLEATNVTVSQLFFSPNGNGIQDTTTMAASTVFDGTTFTLNIKNAGGTTVRTTSTVTGSFSYTWDGKNGSAVTQPDGPYTLELLLTNGPTATASATRTTTLDNTLPTLAITSPTAGQVLSNVYQNGSANVPIVGTIDDTNLNNWELEPWVGGPLIAQGTTPVSAGTIGTWSTIDLSNNPTFYPLGLTAWDKAGNVRKITQNHPVKNFKVAQNSVRQISSPSGGTVTYTSTVPFALHETLVIRNAAGQTVRPILDADRSVGTYNDTWDGRTSAGGLLPDGPYFYVATVTAGSSSMTWDQTNESVGSSGGEWFFRPAVAWDPFNNNRLTYNYTTASPGVTSVIFTTTEETHIGSVCTPERICPVLRRYEESGAHTFRWIGFDENGVFRASEIKRSILVSEPQYMAKNSVILYGTKPTINNALVTPAMYGPSLGGQSITFDLTTYQSQPASVSVSFLNQGSLSVLRTITVASQTPGPVVISWDGLADNGMWAAPGTYILTVTVTDPIGNVVSEQLLTTVQY